MKAACPGPTGCSFNNAQCMVSPLVEECKDLTFLTGLAQKICNTTHAPDCPALEMVTVFRHGYPMVMLSSYLTLMFLDTLP